MTQHIKADGEKQPVQLDLDLCMGSICRRCQVGDVKCSNCPWAENDRLKLEAFELVAELAAPTVAQIKRTLDTHQAER